MAKRVFIVHGWDGYPDEGWFPWIKKELEAKDIEVHIPAMPHPEEPTIEDWVACLEQVVDIFDEQAYFIGHSVGCQTILRTIEKANKKVGGAVLVGPWFSLSGDVNDDPESFAIAKLWYDTPFDFTKATLLSPKIVAIFSDNDPVVPMEENRKVFEEKLGAKIIIEHDKSHFSGDDGITELPIVLESILDIMQ